MTDLATRLHDELAAPCPCGSGKSSILCKCIGGQMPILFEMPDYGPAMYKGVEVPDALRSRWGKPEAYWWRQGVRQTREAEKVTYYRAAADNANKRRERACIGKFAYDDPYAALREMFAMPYRVAEVSDHDLSLYRCEFCDYWHLGKMIYMWNQVVPTVMPEQVTGQMLIRYPEMEDYNPDGYRNTRRGNGTPYGS